MPAGPACQHRTTRIPRGASWIQATATPPRRNGHAATALRRPHGFGKCGSRRSLCSERRAPDAWPCWSNPMTTYRTTYRLLPDGAARTLLPIAKPEGRSATDRGPKARQEPKPGVAPCSHHAKSLPRGSSPRTLRGSTKEIQEKVREYSVEQLPPLAAPDEEDLVVEPVYAYEAQASS